MIKTEELTINGKRFVRTYSDSDRYVVRDGIAYSEAIDPVELGRQYTEGIHMDIDEIEKKARAYDILMGVEE